MNEEQRPPGGHDEPAREPAVERGPKQPSEQLSEQPQEAELTEQLPLGAPSVSYPPPTGSPFMHQPPPTVEPARAPMPTGRNHFFAGAVDGRQLVASPWTPSSWTADADGRVLPELVWAALDCPTYFALYMDGELPMSVLARLAGRIEAPVLDAELDALAETIGRRIDEVPSLDEDRILRGFERVLRYEHGQRIVLAFRSDLGVDAGALQKLAEHLGLGGVTRHCHLHHSRHRRRMIRALLRP